jgi:hypothetical protein
MRVASTAARITIASIAAGLLVSACGDSVPLEPVTVPGKYTLLQVNQRSLPVTILRDSTVEVAVTAGAITLKADSGFVETRSYRVIAAGGSPVFQHDTVVGTWSLAGDKLKFTTGAGDQYEITWSGRVLSWYAEGFAYGYWK